MSNFTIDYNEKISFANIRIAKVLNLQKLRDDAINAFNTKYGDDSGPVALAFALKLSISGSNLERMVPMKVKDHSVTSETFNCCVKPQRGQDVSEETLTVSRFCAAMANDISQYLQVHPDQVRTKIDNVPAYLSFPHNYYIIGLTKEEQMLCTLWLSKHDEIMQKVTNGKWRDLSLKATAYFSASA